MPDGPFHIVVNADSSWYLMLLDIGKVRIYAKPRDLPSEVKKNNKYYLFSSVTAFTRIQMTIKALRDARGF